MDKPAAVSRDPHLGATLAAALLPVLFALALRLTLTPYLGDHSPLVIFTLAVLIAALYGRWMAGFLALGVSLLASWFFFMRSHSPASPYPAHTPIQLTIFFITGIAITLLVERLHRAIESEREARLTLLKETSKRGEAISEADVWRAQLDAVFLSMADGVSVFDPEGNTVLLNDALARINGYQNRTDMLKNLSHFAATFELYDLNGQAVKVDDWPVSRVLRGQTVTDWELLVRRRDMDRTYYVSFSGVPVYNSERELTLGVVVTRDINDRKIAEQALAAERARLASLVESLPAAVLMVDAATGKVAMANSRVAELLGVAHNNWDFLVKSMDLRQADGSPLSPDDFPLALGLRGEEKMGELIVLRPDRTQIWIRYRTAPVRMNKSEIAGAVMVFADVSNEKSAEEKLRRSELKFREMAENLEQQVSERTQELVKKDAELQQAKRLEAIGRFAGGVAHEFNNLLTGIRGMSVEIAENLSVKDPYHENAMQIVQASDRAFDVTRQLLAFSRRQVIQPRVVDLKTTVIELGKLLRRVIGEMIHLEFDLKQTSAVKVDPGQIEQILMNLVVNAKDAMPNGGEIRIRTFDQTLGTEEKGFLQAATGAYVCLEVSDTGTGLPPDALLHLFEPFYTTKEKHKGTGLGLATIHGIVKQNGGEITVESQLDKGTTFRIFLPVTSEAVSQNASKSQEEAAGSHETILLVEDEDIVRRVVARRLVHGGYRVVEARNGEEALVQIAAHPEVSAVVSDVIMPRMNGRDLARALRERYPGLGVILMSGYPDEIVAQGGIVEAGIDFIQKPDLPSYLMPKLKEVIASRTTKKT